MFDENSKVWIDEQYMDLKDAKVSILTHALHYGSSVFEGIRCYETDDGAAIFRLKDHMKRLKRSAAIYKMLIPYSVNQLADAAKGVVKANEFKSCYIRPIAYRGYGSLGINGEDNPVNTAVAAWEWGAYMGEKQLEKGVDVCISSWAKPAPSTLPLMAKAGANYMNSQLANMEAKEKGYAEAIQLDTNGMVAEGSGENIFIVEGNKLITPPLGSILDGITRDTVKKIASKLEYEVVEEPISRERLYLADEVFFTGSAAEITPIRSIDGRKIGNGKRGTLTRQMQTMYFNIANGKVNVFKEWLTYV